MRNVCYFNGVRWIHDYQVCITKIKLNSFNCFLINLLVFIFVHLKKDACVDKLERFMRGELNIRNVDTRTGLGRGIDLTAPSTPGTASSMRTNPPSYQRMHSNDSNKDLKDGINNGRISD